MNVYTFDAHKGWERNTTVCQNITLTSFRRTPLSHIKTPMDIYISNPKKDFISREIVTKSGMFEKEEFDVMHRFFGDKDFDFIDIGANLGIHSLKFAELGKRVFSVEVSRDMVRRLCASAQFNNFEGKVTILHNALGRNHSSARLIQTDGEFGLNFVESEDTNKVMFGFYGKSIFKGTKVTYKAAILDDILKVPTFKGVKNVFIKIDVEGSEHHVIAGIDKLFKTINVGGIFMEWNKQYGHPSGNEIVAKLTERGFEAFDCNGKSCLKLDKQGLKKNLYNILWLKKGLFPGY